MDDLISNLNAVELEDCLDTELDGHEMSFTGATSAIHTSRMDILPLEVVNDYCREHFDDEDFIYVKFELPQAIQDILSHERVDIINYMRNDLAAMVSNPAYSQCVRTVYGQIIWLYDKLMDFYMDEDGYEAWEYEMKLRVAEVCHLLTYYYNMDMNHELYKDVNPYGKEIYYGLGLILTQLEFINKFYAGGKPMSKRHLYRYIRLVNNMCIIFIHNRFSCFESGAATEPYEEPMVNPSWMLKYAADE